MSADEMSSREISDRLQIQDVLIRYCTAVDTLDYTLLDTCFTADAVLDYSAMDGPTGSYPEVRRWLEKSLCLLYSFQHSISNTVYCFDSERATTRTMFRNPNTIRYPDGSLQLFTVGGYYDDELTRTADGWKISRRTEVFGYFDGERPDRKALGGHG